MNELTSKHQAATGDDADVKTVTAVERAFSILGAFGDDDVFLSLTGISERTGLYKSTILRLAHTLERLGYLGRRADGVYHIGPAPLRLGRLFQAGVKSEDVLLPAMRKLVADTGESASFYIRFGDKRLCLYRVDSAQLLRDHFRVGEVLPLRGSGGQILVAFSRPYAPRHSALRQRLVAVSSGSLARDMAGLGAPVFDAANELVGALGISGAATRFGEDSILRFEYLVLEAARRATAALGGDTARFDERLARSQSPVRARAARIRQRPLNAPAQAGSNGKTTRHAK